jgi:hypothetical protein
MYIVSNINANTSPFLAILSEADIIIVRLLYRAGIHHELRCFHKKTQQNSAHAKTSLKYTQYYC